LLGSPLPPSGVYVNLISQRGKREGSDLAKPATQMTLRPFNNQTWQGNFCLTGFVQSHLPQINNSRGVCFNFLMNGIVRASIHIYNYKQASVHKTDEVRRSRQDQLRHSLQTNPTWTQPVKKSARVKRVNVLFPVFFTCRYSTRLTCHVLFMVLLLVLFRELCQCPAI